MTGVKRNWKVDGKSERMMFGIVNTALVQFVEDCRSKILNS